MFCFTKSQNAIHVPQEVKKEPGRRDRYLISIPNLFRYIPKREKNLVQMSSASRAASCVAPAPPHDGEPSFAGLVQHYPQTKNKFIKAPLKHTICSVPFHDTLVSAMRVFPIPSEYNPIEILKFICVQFTARMEVIVVAQRGALISPDYKLTNMKNDIGKILSGKGTYRSKQLPPYIPGILSSDILSKPWRHFIKEHIIQPHVDKNARVRSHDECRSSASEDEEYDKESAPAPAGGARGEVSAMRKAGKSQPQLEEGKRRQRSPSPPNRRLRSQHSSQSAAGSTPGVRKSYAYCEANLDLAPNFVLNFLNNPSFEHQMKKTKDPDMISMRRLLDAARLLHSIAPSQVEMDVDLAGSGRSGEEAREAAAAAAETSEVAEAAEAEPPSVSDCDACGGIGSGKEAAGDVAAAAQNSEVAEAAAAEPPSASTGDAEGGSCDADGSIGEGEEAGEAAAAAPRSEVAEAAELPSASAGDADCGISSGEEAAAAARKVTEAAEAEPPSASPCDAGGGIDNAEEAAGDAAAATQNSEVAEAAAAAHRKRLPSPCPSVPAHLHPTPTFPLASRLVVFATPPQSPSPPVPARAGCPLTARPSQVSGNRRVLEADEAATAPPAAAAPVAAPPPSAAKRPRTRGGAPASLQRADEQHADGAGGADSGNEASKGERKERGREQRCACIWCGQHWHPLLGIL